MEKINLVLQKFWGTENIAIENVLVFKVHEKTALDVAEGSITYNEGRYRIAILWKENFANLPNKIDMAERRQQNLERRLLR